MSSEDNKDELTELRAQLYKAKGIDGPREVDCYGCGKPGTLMPGDVQYGRLLVFCDRCYDMMAFND